jgi:hypothetical protein
MARSCDDEALGSRIAVFGWLDLEKDSRADGCPELWFGGARCTARRRTLANIYYPFATTRTLALGIAVSRT